LRHVFPAVAILTPVIKGISRRRGPAVKRRLIASLGSRDANLFAWMNGERLAAGGCFALAASYRHDRRIALVVDLDPVFARPQQ
jgi:hypothetical protein